MAVSLCLSLNICAPTPHNCKAAVDLEGHHRFICKPNLVTPSVIIHKRHQSADIKHRRAHSSSADKMARDRMTLLLNSGGKYLA